MANKPIQISAVAPKEAKPYAMLPIGLYCNKELQNAKIGDVVEFSVDWRRDKRRLVRKCKVVVQSSTFTFLMKSLYGERMTWAELSERWRAECIVAGLGRDAFSEAEVMMIEVEGIGSEEL